MTGRRPALARPMPGRTIGRLALALSLAATLACPARAVTLDLPGNANVTAEASETGAIFLPVGAFADGTVPRREFQGRVSRQAWTIAGALTTWQVMAPLREQLQADGFDLLVDCDTLACGGFDFRFALDVLPEPAMHVDLGDFRYLAASRKTDAGTEAIALLASRSSTAAFLQIDVVETAAEPAPAGTESQTDKPVTIGAGGSGSVPNGVPFRPGSLTGLLDDRGHVVLDDLTFDTGSTDLGPGPYASLAELAAYLKDHPGRRIALVGHTDATGGLDVNIAVSRRRAQSVLDRLAKAYGIPRGQLDAEGVGYLAPRASNLTEAGRTANRRVEAVLTSVE